MGNGTIPIDLKKNYTLCYDEKYSLIFVQDSNGYSLDLEPGAEQIYKINIGNFLNDFDEFDKVKEAVILKEVDVGNRETEVVREAEVVAAAASSIAASSIAEQEIKGMKISKIVAIGKITSSKIPTEIEVLENQGEFKPKMRIYIGTTENSIKEINGNIFTLNKKWEQKDGNNIIGLEESKLTLENRRSSNDKQLNDVNLELKVDGQTGDQTGDQTGYQKGVNTGNQTGNQTGDQIHQKGKSKDNFESKSLIKEENKEGLNAFNKLKNEYFEKETDVVEKDTVINFVNKKIKNVYVHDITYQGSWVTDALSNILEFGSENKPWEIKTTSKVTCNTNVDLEGGGQGVTQIQYMIPNTITDYQNFLNSNNV